MTGFTVALGPRGLLLSWATAIVVFAARVITARDAWSLRPGSSPEALRNGLASVLFMIAGGVIVVLVLLPFSLTLYLALGGVCVLFFAAVVYFSRQIGITS
jgi:hypothetical protein